MTPFFDKIIFEDLREEFGKFAGSYYSPFKIQKVLKKIDQIIDDNELQFVQHSVSETLDDNTIDIIFKIFEGPKVQLKELILKETL